MTEKLNPRIGYGTGDMEEKIRFNAEAVRAHTRNVFEPLYWENIANNMEDIIIEGSLASIDRYNSPCLVVAGGPSIQRYNQLTLIAEHPAYDKRLFKLVICDKILKDATRAGLQPNIVVTMDPTPLTEKYFKDVLKQPGTIVAVGITTNPKTARAARKIGSVRWWVPMWDDYRGTPIGFQVECPRCKEKFAGQVVTDKSYTKIMHYMTKAVILQTFGNVGATSIYTALHMGCNPVAFIGFDLGYPADMPIEQDQYFKAYENLIEEENKKRDEVNSKIAAMHQKAVKLYDKEKKRYEKKHGRSLDPSNNIPPAAPEKLPHVTIYDLYHYIINPDTQKHILMNPNWDSYRLIFLDFVKGSQALKDPAAKRTFINCSPESSVYGPHIVTRDLKNWLDGLVK